MVRRSASTRETLARTCASRRFGTAIAARMAMIATTISNSISVKPCLWCIPMHSRSVFVPTKLLPRKTTDPARRPGDDRRAGNLQEALLRNHGDVIRDVQDEREI